MFLDMSLVHYDLHEGHLSDERVIQVLDLLGCREKDVKLKQLISGGHSTLDGDI